jgi:hypothetical protein
MKATVDIPEDLQQVVKDIAHDFSLSTAEAVVWLMRRGVGEELERPLLRINEFTGFPSFDTGRLITQSEVERFLDQDE